MGESSKFDNFCNYDYYISDLMNSAPSTRGHTLIELLITVLVVATILLAATAKLRGTQDAATTARDQQNAQKLASMALSAQAAGLDLVDAEGDLVRTVGNLSAGGEVVSGVFAGETFRVRLGEHEAEGVLPYLEIRNGVLVYRPE